MMSENYKFTAEPNLNVEDYRPMSMAAVASAILGPLSVVTVVNQVLMFIPLLGIVLGTVALVRIQSKKGQVSGAMMATTGVCLSLFFATWSTSYQWNRSSRIYAQSTAHCERWFDLIYDGHLYEAFELKERYSNRKMVGTDLELVYSVELGAGSREDFADLAHPDQQEAGIGAAAMMPGTPKFEFDSFFGDEPMSTVVQHREEGRFEHLHNEVIKRDGYLDLVQQVYAFNYQDESGADQQLKIRIFLERWNMQDADYNHWNILKVEQIDDPRGA